jgi:hypothetical protein
MVLVVVVVTVVLIVDVTVVGTTMEVVGSSTMTVEVLCT